MKRSKLLLASVVIAVALCATAPGLAMGVRAHLPDVIVVGNQVYEGGVLTLRSVSGGDLVQLAVDGRPIALLAPVVRGNRASDARPQFVFQRDERGLLHFAYVLYDSQHGNERQVISFRITALRSGLATLPNHAAYGETLYLAKR